MSHAGWVLLALGFLGACASAPVVSQEGVAVEVRPLGARPVAYFERACAGCHGEEGSLYAAGFGERLTDEALADKVRTMASGPAQAPIEGRELDAQVAYHRSMIAGEPFLVFVGARGEDLVFESSPGATVTAVGEGRRLRVRRAKPDDESENALWLVPNVGELTVTAAREKKKVSLDPVLAAWSHGAPRE